MLIAIAILVTIILFIIIYVVYQLSTEKTHRVKDRLLGMRSERDDARPADMYWREQMNRSFSERVIKPALDKLAAKITSIAPSNVRAYIEEQIEACGGFNGLGVSGFLLLWGASTFFSALLGLRFAFVKADSAGMAIYMFILFTAAGVYVPTMLLRSKVQERREAIRQAMPDVLDLLCVSVQAGLGFDAALGKVTAKMKGPLIEEFERLLQELRMGVTRRNALTRLANRCGVEEMKLFTAALIQAETLGVGMAQVLEIQSENMREMRRQRAKEAAAKLPVKVLFPTMVFIFPVLFIVVLGPAIVTIMNSFK